MNVVIDKIPALVNEELEAANAIHSFFHSQHEGYAVLLEEVEEAGSEMNDLNYRLKQLWTCVKHNYTKEAYGYARDVENRAIRLAAEAIQVAAMARKFRGTGINTLIGGDAK